MLEARSRWLSWLALALAPAGAASAGRAGELLYSTEGNRLRRIDVDSVDARPLAEGFATDVVLYGATLEVVPEPRALALLAACAATLPAVLRRRARAS